MNHPIATNSLVSIIIPVFNDSEGVVHCLRAISTQSYPITSIEAIVVDNASEPAIALDEAFPFDVQVLQHLTPGSYAARNAGAAIAKGDFLAFLDADCWPDKDWISNGIDALVIRKGEAIVGGEVSIVTTSHPSAVALYQEAVGFGQEGNIRDKGFSATANLFCTRQQFETIGPFDTRLLSGGDREWCWRGIELGFHVNYAPNAVVRTLPRGDLWSAIRQARRVAAGRRTLHRLGLTHIGAHATRKRRSPWASMVWILTRSELRLRDRLRMLGVATLIHIATVAERVRLSFGTQAERR